MSLGRTLRAWSIELEGSLSSALGLAPITLPGELARREGTWKGAPVTIEARAFASGGIAYARFVRMSGRGLEIGNLLCLPRCDVPLPILGADLVWLGRDTAMVAADLVPTSRDVAGPMLAARLDVLPLAPSGGDLPAWASAWFSPHALYARATVAEMPVVWRRLHAFASVYAELAQHVDPVPDEETAIHAAVQGYGAAHRDSDKGLTMLGKMFGEEWATRFIGEVLFPIEVGA